ncbi:anti-phage ZorAB system protein ZorA [Cupriavidus plantarum]|uniref:Anti-phage defense ZorAB system ZorA n=1 Tax=Cupriavidus plantarum TaxID=942865 RepID=A0A316EZI6_9BURK|nr:anti-phage ZorAB system protein ZorA [Cupriavidus plantarum]PWK37666.1 hypothetical protein C7419_1011549 [Cupriavidus plantarum]
MTLEFLLASAPTSVLVAGAALAVLIIASVALFFIPGVTYVRRLKRVQDAISSFAATNYVEQFEQLFSTDRRLAHHWAEYRKTLHEQYEERDGQIIVTQVRATAPAELYFNSQTVVDSRLGTEFFKHLPGIFTGIGIIGTFFGLIAGLGAFQVSENAATVRTSLESLMHSVEHAFYVSGSAILVAILVTFLEKWLVAVLYRRTEDIAHAIDRSFKAGAGEEYMSRLVKASEESASQAKILKDALVQELGELLRELTGAQIAASKEQQSQVVERLVQASREQLEAARLDTQALGNTIAESIQQSLRGPLEEIASTVKTASGDQSATASRMLQDVMTSFSQRLNDLFGGQISGLNELNQQTARSMQEAVGTLQALVANVEASSQRSTDAMAQRMAEAVEKMESRQEAMNEQSAAFVDQIRELVSKSQSETNQKLQETLETMGEQVKDMLTVLNGSQSKVSESNQAREQAMSEQFAAFIDQMRQAVASSQTETQEKLQNTLAAVGDQMTSMLASLNGSQREVFENTQVREQAMNKQLGTFVEQVQQSVASAQAEAQQTLQKTVESMGSQVASVVATLNSAQEDIFERNRAREQDMAERANGLVASMAQAVQSVVQELRAATSQMSQSVSGLSQATASSVSKMNAGAEQLGTAARNFATAGERVSGVMGQTATVSAKLTETAGSLSTGGNAIQDLLRDYREQRNAISQLVVELRATVEAARKEATLTGDILQRIEGSASRLGEAQKEADVYLAGVSRVLGEAHTSFAAAMRKTLGEANTEFQKRLSSSVNLLSSAVEELEATLAAMGNLAPVRR